MAEEKLNKNGEPNVDDINLTNDKLMQVLSQLTATDIEKLEQMAKGEFNADPKGDEKILKYLQIVNSLFGNNHSLFANDASKSRLSRYETYDEMEETVAYISSALDIMSDDATQPDEDGIVIHVRSENAKVQSLVEKMVVDLELQEKVSKWSRVVAKYGDFFVEVDGHEGEGVTRVDDSHYPGHIERKEIDGELAAFVNTTETDPKRAVKAPWEFIHFRHKGDIYRRKEQTTTGIDGKSKYKLSSSYGQSVLQPAIRVFTQLRFVENIIILSRLTNSIRRNIFLINTGDVSAEKSVETVKLYADLLKKDITLDLDKGVYDSKKQTVKYDEDIFLPVSDTKNDIRVEQIGGDVNISEQYDLEYLLNKLFASLKIPKAYLNYEQDLNARSTLIQLDIRYARSVARLQQTIVGGLIRLAKIHLAYNGIDANNVDLDIQLSSVSSIESEIRRQEREQNLNNARTFIEVMGSMKTALSGGDPMGMGMPPEEGAEPPEEKLDMEYATYYVMREYLDMKEEDIGKMLKFDTKRFKDTSQATNESKVIAQHRIYENSDNKAPLPTASYQSEYERIRESIKFEQVTTEV